MSRSWLLMFYVLIAESILILVLIPSTWTESVISKEAELLEQRLGVEERNYVHDHARSWFDTTLVSNGLYEAVYYHLIPTEEQKARSLGMEEMGHDWFVWVEGRLEALANVWYHMLTRAAQIMSWAPYMLILLVPAIYDGYTSWRIKRTNFAYSSPTLHSYAAKSTFVIVAGTVAAFMAPIVLDPAILPIVLMVLCILIGIFMGNMQKRL